MKRKIVAIVLSLLLLVSLTACASFQSSKWEASHNEQGETPQREDEPQQEQDDVDEQYADESYADEPYADVEESYVIDGIEVSDFTLNIRDWNNFAWEYEYFADIRQPIRFDESMPHGYLAVQYIMLLNDHLYARTPFSYREKEAAVWLVEELMAMGYSWEDIYVQEFNFEDNMFWMNMEAFITTVDMWSAEEGFFDTDLRYTTQLSQNVILTVPGQSEQTIIVGAHYDTLPVHGASDNASGTALLLESARRMMEVDNYYTIVYVFFGAEEIGLVGAHYFVDSLTRGQSNNIQFMINADVLFEGPYLIYSALYTNNEWDDETGSPHVGTNAITQQVDAIANELGFGFIGYPNVAHRIASDFVPFLQAGHTVVNLAGLAGAEYPYDGWVVEVDGEMFMLHILHTPDDDFYVIEERWPGKIIANMHAFSIFLEEMLMINLPT